VISSLITITIIILMSTHYSSFTSKSSTGAFDFSFVGIKDGVGIEAGDGRMV